MNLAIIINIGGIYYFTHSHKGHHDHLLEIRLLEKSARHDFSFARHHSSNNYFSC